MADSGLVLRLTRSRLWIGLLGTLLVGIVGLNVMALSFNAAASKTAATSDQLRSENSALAADIQNGLSNERLQSVAARLGLVVPEPGAILYLEPAAGDAAKAARRLRAGRITLGAAAPPPTVVPAAPVATAATPLPTETAPEPVAATPASPEAEPVATAPAPAPAAPPAAAGGVALP